MSRQGVRANSFACISVFSAFEVFLLSKTQADLVAVAAGALAVLGDSGTEAGHTAAVHTEVAAGTVAWKDGLWLKLLRLLL